jgi:hypothetical protein
MRIVAQPAIAGASPHAGGWSLIPTSEVLVLLGKRKAFVSQVATREQKLAKSNLPMRSTKDSQCNTAP